MKRFKDDSSHDILPVPMAGDISSHVPPNLIHGNCLLVAPTASGKSYVLSNLIIRPSFGYSKEFDRIIVMSPTIYTDKMWNTVLDSNYAKHIEIVPQYDEAFLTQLMNEQDADVEREKAEKKNRKKRGDGAGRSYVPNGIPATDFMSALANITIDEPEDTRTPPFKAKRVLIILDDVVDSLPSSNSRTILDRLAFRGRHAQITLWLAVQSFKRTPRNIRINIKNVIIFSINDSELQKVAEELAQESIDNFKAIVHYATREQYSFLFLNTRAPKDQRYRLRFGDFIQMK
jgi:hypothetical protein